MTDSMEKEVLDYIMAATATGWPASWYFGLFTAAPGEASAGTEVSGGSYARVAVTRNNTNFPAAATDGSNVTTIDNDTVVQFPTATANWGTVTHWGIFDASSGGVLKIYGALTTSRSVLTGDAPKFAVGSFVLTAN